MGETTAKQALFEQLARIPKAVAHPARLELLDLLAQGERSVDDLARVTGNGMTTVSAQLQELRRAHLVETRREGTRIYYRLAGDDVVRFIAALQAVAANRIAEVPVAARRFLGDDTDVEAIDRDDLRRRGWPARSSWLMYVRPSSTKPDTFRAHGRSHSMSSTHASVSYLSTWKSSPIAVARTAHSPTKPCDACATMAVAHDA